VQNCEPMDSWQTLAKFSHSTHVRVLQFDERPESEV